MKIGRSIQLLPTLELSIHTDRLCQRIGRLQRRTEVSRLDGMIPLMT